MLVDPLPGVTRDQLLESLRQLSAELTSAFAATFDPYAQYIRWANAAAQRLSRLVTVKEVERLVLTRRYWLLQSMPGNALIPPVTTLLNAEFDERRRDLEDAERALRDQIQRWSQPGEFVMPDTSFYVTHREKLEVVDFARHLKVWEDPIHVLVPILVVDELDGLKQSGNQHVRWRAGYTLAVLDNRLSMPNEAASLRPGDFTPLNAGGIPRGEVTVEVLFDPPGHVRLPINDDEVIDRAVTAEAFAGRPVTILTYDTGQAMRARAARLKTVKLDIERGAEPPRA